MKNNMINVAESINNPLVDGNRWTVNWKVEKYKNDADFRAGIIGETYISEGNALLNEGINFIWNAVVGASITPFNSANSFIGVGDSNAAVVPTQTGLVSTTNKKYNPMDSGYPIAGANNKIIFKSTFGPSDANFPWREWTVANGSSDSATNLNRKVEPMGEKYDGSTWVITVEISLT